VERTSTPSGVLTLPQLSTARARIRNRSSGAWLQLGWLAQLVE
jgi:hypothetical protein